MQTREIARLLPEVFRATMGDGSPLDGAVGAMAELLDPVDRRLDHLERYFDPFRTPTPMLPYLAHWVDLGWVPIAEAGGGDGVAAEHLRVLIAKAPDLAKRRGTLDGLTAMIRAVTGVADIGVREVDSVNRPFHLRIELPVAHRDLTQLVDTVVRAERPAHLTYDIVTVG